VSEPKTTSDILGSERSTDTTYWIRHRVAADTANHYI